MKPKENYVKELIWMSLLILISWYFGNFSKVYGIKCSSNPPIEVTTFPAK